jgi:hypothetical protein
VVGGAPPLRGDGLGLGGRVRVGRGGEGVARTQDMYCMLYAFGDPKFGG